MIEVRNLSKSFGRKKAVDEVTFQVARGEVLGFLGPNGAGKSTTMRMITGYLEPDSGSVAIGGLDVQEKPIAVRRLIGYLPESAPAYSDLSVTDFLNFAAEMRGLRGPARRRAVDQVIEKCFLGPVRHQNMDTLSKGYRHRACLAQAILHDPEVLIMDEPTDGLDPNQKHEVRQLIREMGRTKAIVFSTHILEEVEAACTRALVIDRGRVVANGTPAELKARARHAGCLRLVLRGTAIEEKLRHLPLLDKLEVLPATDGTHRFRLHPRDPLNSPSLEESVAHLSLANSWHILEMTREEGRLDDFFRSVTLPDTVG